MPWAIWKYMGRYDIEAMRANRVTSPASVVSTKLRLRNSASGMMGCIARRSASTNRTTSTAVAANSPMICGLSHA